ncbi:diguanylate cyclase [Paraglaciecola aquimarina]|uniref:diguanylate cyclase n=1 Tax=Paraglaciecola algarum TaxID=3050085 RepID=A0ABS9DBA8_9ALTE|nr:diguanylate cyclase [Paraglaciecola sp. G1-23]MCF2949667.1 diguanylate cyclase [Paraglaciecola sp. G1-23]
MSNQNFEAKLKELRELFTSTLPDKMAEVLSLWENTLEDWTEANCKKCIFELHSLKGSSGTLGFKEISAAFSDCESKLKAIHDFSQSPESELVFQLKQAFDRLVVAQEKLLSTNQQPSKVSLRQNLEPSSKILKPSDIQVLVVDYERSSGELLKKLLSEFGFNTSYAKNLTQAKQLHAETKMHIVLLDLVMPDCTVDEIFSFAKDLEKQNTRAVILSGQDNFDVRLGAIHANVSDFIVKPYQITNLVAKIRSALLLDLVRPFKVFLVDDQESVASYFQSTLQAYDMDVKVLLDPTKILESLKEYDPDIFLFDLFMPEVNGIELAKIIRLMEKYDSIPIVFLTSENTIETKLEVLEVGCDDVLPKNISPDVLVKQVSSRLKRGHELRYLNSRDSLTGLLNHGQIMDAASSALQLGIRRRTPTIFAMIDLDYFKAVNDTHGHAAGDKVLMGLGQLLLQHVRQTDYIGRYGGEEFLLVFPDSELEVIKQKLDHIREILSSLMFKHGNKEFNVTYSAGIASSEDYESLADILIAADSALYRAKEKGRNNVQIK